MNRSELAWRLRLRFSEGYVHVDAARDLLRAGIDPGVLELVVVAVSADGELQQRAGYRAQREAFSSQRRREARRFVEICQRGVRA